MKVRIEFLHDAAPGLMKRDIFGKKSPPKTRQAFSVLNYQLSASSGSQAASDLSLEPRSANASFKRATMFCSAKRRYLRGS